MTKPLKVTATQARRLQRNLKGNDDMTQNELIKTVKAKLPTREAVTANWIQCRYRVLQSQARKCIEQLQSEGLIGKEWSMSLGGYPVVKEEKVTGT